MKLHSAWIAGASGYTGKHLVPHLLDQKIRAIAHFRPGSSSLPTLAPDFESQGATIDQSPWELHPLTQALATHKPEAIFCLIGTTKSRMKALKEEGEDAEMASYQAVDFGLTKLLIDAALAASISPLFVYLSAMGAQNNGPGAYIKARWQAEHALFESGLPYLIARPGLITGDREESRPGEELGGTLAHAAASTMEFFGAKKLSARWRPITGDGLAKALLHHALESPPNSILEAEDLKI